MGPRKPPRVTDLNRYWRKLSTKSRNESFQSMGKLMVSLRSSYKLRQKRKKNQTVPELLLEKRNPVAKKDLECNRINRTKCRNKSSNPTTSDTLDIGSETLRAFIRKTRQRKRADNTGNLSSPTLAQTETNASDSLNLSTSHNKSSNPTTSDSHTHDEFPSETLAAFIRKIRQRKRADNTGNLSSPTLAQSKTNAIKSNPIDPGEKKYDGYDGRHDDRDDWEGDYGYYGPTDYGDHFFYSSPTHSKTSDTNKNRIESEDIQAETEKGNKTSTSGVFEKNDNIFNKERRSSKRIRDSKELQDRVYREKPNYPRRRKVNKLHDQRIDPMSNTEEFKLLRGWTIITQVVLAKVPTIESPYSGKDIRTDYDSKIKIMRKNGELVASYDEVIQHFVRYHYQEDSLIQIGLIEDDVYIIKNSSKSKEKPAPPKNVIDRYVENFPKKYSELIDTIHEIAGDGNCGFRAIAKALDLPNGQEDWRRVRFDMLKELTRYADLYTSCFGSVDRFEEISKALDHKTGPASAPYWFKIPDMGHLVATTYNVAVLVLGENNACTTFLPLRLGPDGSKKIICIGHVNGDHYVVVNFKAEPPLPPVSRHWQKFKYAGSAMWKESLKANFESFKVEQFYETPEDDE